MQALLKGLTRLLLRVTLKPVLGSRLPLGGQRRWLAALSRATGNPREVERQQLWVGDVPLLRLRPSAAVAVGPAAASERDAILYVHGGGFTLGGGTTYAGFAARIAAATGADVYLPDYRLAPDDPYPAPADDLFAAYRTILELGHAPGRTAVIGDSAGGALAAGLTLVLPEMDVPSPAALILLSPFLDLSLSGASVAANARLDPVITRRFLEAGGRAHAGALRRSDPRISPLFATLGTLPPTLIQVGSDEILLDDSIRFADRAWAAGVEIELQRFEGLWHDFQTAAGSLRAARGALDDLTAFLGRRLIADGPDGQHPSPVQ